MSSKFCQLGVCDFVVASVWSS